MTDTYNLIVDEFQIEKLHSSITFAEYAVLKTIMYRAPSCSVTIDDLDGLSSDDRKETKKIIDKLVEKQFLCKEVSK